MEYQVQELFIDDVDFDKVVDLTVGMTKPGGRPRAFQIPQLDITIAADVEVERKIRVGAVPGSDAIQIFMNWNDVIVYVASRRTAKPIRFFWRNVLFEKSVVVGLGEGELLVFYHDGYRRYEYPNNFDIQYLTVEGEEVLVKFSHGDEERYGKLDVNDNGLFTLYQGTLPGHGAFV